MTTPPDRTQRIAANVKLGQRVRLHGFVNLYGCEIGDDVKIGTFVEIQKGAKVGNRCKVSSHTFICEGVTIEDEVFVGHNVTFINDLYPRATADAGGLQTEADWECRPTLVKRGASIGSSATILCGITVGERALIGAGSVVTKDVPADTVVAGNPARVLKVLPRNNRDSKSSLRTPQSDGLRAPNSKLKTQNSKLHFRTLERRVRAKSASQLLPNADEP